MSDLCLSFRQDAYLRNVIITAARCTPFQIRKKKSKYAPSFLKNLFCTGKLSFPAIELKFFIMY